MTVGLHYRAKRHVRTDDERECYMCRGKGCVLKAGGHMMKWYRCKKCDGTGSIPKANNKEVSVER